MKALGLYTHTHTGSLKENKKKNIKGITLVALIITIIILLILAGVTINQLQEGNLFYKAKQSQEIHRSERAKEKLQMSLMNIATEKETSKDYNKNEYLTKKLEKEGFTVNDNIIIVDDYCFEIDRDKLEIVSSKGENKNNVFIVYSIYDNQDSNNIKAKLKFYNEKGIKSIEKPDGEIIDGENKEEVIIDYTINPNLNENFNVTLSDNSIIESNLKITENGMNETFKISENVEENGFANIKIDYDNKESTDKTYYKIGENGEWYQYTDSIQLDMAAIENVTDTTENEGTSLIYIKKEDANGNIVTIAKEVKINSTAYNTLSNIRYKGEDPDKYFSKNTPSTQFDPSYVRDNYLIPYFGFGHWQSSGSYGSVFKLEWSKLGLKTANKIKINFNHYRERSNDWVGTYAQVYYTDGTTSELKESTHEFDESWTIWGGIETRTSVTLDLDETKTVDYIEIQINVWDSYGGSAYGIIRDIVFFGATK